MPDVVAGKPDHEIGKAQIRTRKKQFEIMRLESANFDVITKKLEFDAQVVANEAMIEQLQGEIKDSEKELGNG